jgi:uncharacterized protein (UPF0218 family)
MATRYRLTPELRKKLKKPIGTLVRGSLNETMKKLKDLVEKENPPMIISVGDIVSKNLTRNNMFPKLSIVDNKVMRKRIQPIALTTGKTLYVKNPPGTITEEALAAIQEALEHNRRVKIVVDGEEDLLTLAAVLYASKNSFVVYGQPLEGIVVVKVTQQKKAEVTEVLKAMEVFRKAK